MAVEHSDPRKCKTARVVRSLNCAAPETVSALVLKIVEGCMYGVPLFVQMPTPRTRQAGGARVALLGGSGAPRREDLGLCYSHDQYYWCRSLGLESTRAEP
eukprot:11891834-Alexandrium_andersonii.AAC.1